MHFTFLQVLIFNPSFYPYAFSFRLTSRHEGSHISSVYSIHCIAKRDASRHVQDYVQYVLKIHLFLIFFNNSPTALDCCAFFFLNPSF